MVSIGMDRQLALPILFSRSYPMQDWSRDALYHFGSLPFLACFIAGFPAFQNGFKEKDTSRDRGYFPSGHVSHRFYPHIVLKNRQKFTIEVRI